MPFKSKAQMRMMFAQHPEMAKEWASHMTASQIKRMPRKVKAKKVRKKT